MANVRVSPDEFVLMKFDPEEIAAITRVVCDDVGLGAHDVVDLVIDESTPLNRVALRSVAPIVLEIEGGAMEDLKYPRTLSVENSRDVLVRVLLRATDRCSATFSSAPAEEELSLAQAEAWDAFCCGRAERLGYAMQRQRRLYNFRNRHGFTDAADAAFDSLWSGTAPTWSHIEQLCQQTARSRV